MKTIDKPELIRIIAERAGFTQGDVRIILDELVKLFEESVRKGVVIKIYGFGRIIYQQLKERKMTKGKYAGMTFPSTTKVIFRLAETIRFADREDE